MTDYMKQDGFYENVEKIGVMPVVVLEKLEDAVPMGNALTKGGLPAAEVTFRTSAAADCIHAMATKCPDVLVGAGTVLNLDQAKRAVDAGAKFIVSRGLAKPGQKVFNLHTRSGLVKPALLDDGRVCVDMGNPRDFLGSIKLTAHCFDFTAETVSMGNPHAVIFVDDINKIQLEDWGRVLECDKQFPDRCNIEFAQVLHSGQETPTQIRMRVWERGCGVTMACGTGSCATLVAAQRTGRVGVEADIVLDGGVLHIKHENDGPVLMTGPAQEVFKGTI